MLEVGCGHSWALRMGVGSLDSIEAALPLFDLQRVIFRHARTPKTTRAKDRQGRQFGNLELKVSVFVRLVKKTLILFGALKLEDVF